MALSFKANKQPTVGFIGGGNMAQSLIGGLISNGFERDSISVSDPSAEARNYVAESYQVRVEASNESVIANSSTVVLAVKPQVMRTVLEAVSNIFQSSNPLIISIAAGIRLCDLDTWTGGNLAIVRVMPNTPALIQKGISALYANSQVSDSQKTQVQTILSAVGNTVWLPDEALLDAVTAVSGSGPAYFFYLIESMEQAALELGLNAATARTLATETAVGAALLSVASSQSPGDLRHQVTSPGGVTEAAIQVLENNSVKQSFVDAIQAGERRSVEMSQSTPKAG